ncbi:hypothetical protein GW17_00024704 [Ensete ventricosum]|nr:hypothetical protein GW17_00024704 [Ensete ventricosum]
MPPPSQAIPTIAFDVCNFDLYRPVRAVHTGPPCYRYADRPLPAVPSKIGRRRPILKEIDCRRSIEQEKGKKKRKKKKKKRGLKNTSPASSSCACHPCDRGRFFSRTRRWSVSPREETERGDGPVPVPTICRYTGTDR